MSNSSGATELPDVSVPVIALDVERTGDGPHTTTQNNITFSVGIAVLHPGRKQVTKYIATQFLGILNEYNDAVIVNLKKCLSEYESNKDEYRFYLEAMRTHVRRKWESKCFELKCFDEFWGNIEQGHFQRLLQLEIDAFHGRNTNYHTMITSQHELANWVNRTLNSIVGSTDRGWGAYKIISDAMLVESFHISQLLVSNGYWALTHDRVSTNYIGSGICVDSYRKGLFMVDPAATVFDGEMSNPWKDDKTYQEVYKDTHTHSPDDDAENTLTIFSAVRACIKEKKRKRSADAELSKT